MIRRNDDDDEKGVICKPIRCYICDKEIVVVHNAKLKTDYYFIKCENCQLNDLR